MSTFHICLLVAYVVIFIGHPWLFWYWKRTHPNAINERINRRFSNRG